MVALVFLAIAIPVYLAFSEHWLWIFGIFGGAAIIYIITKISEYYLPSWVTKKQQ